MKYAVHTKTQNEYDKLMIAYEKAGWKWMSGHNPTEYSLFNKGIQIEFKKVFGIRGYYGSLKSDMVDTIISVDEAIKKLEKMFPEKFGQSCGQNMYLHPITGSVHKVKYKLTTTSMEDPQVQALLGDKTETRAVMASRLVQMEKAYKHNDDSKDREITRLADIVEELINSRNHFRERTIVLEGQLDILINNLK